MPNQILQVDENMLETKLDRLVSEKVEELLNAMLDAEADEITGAARYERSGERKAYRAGHYERNLTVKAGTMTPGGAEAEGRGLRVGGHRTLPASRAELFLVKLVFRFSSGIFFGFGRGCAGRVCFIGFGVCRT